MHFSAIINNIIKKYIFWEMCVAGIYKYVTLLLIIFLLSNIF